MICLAVVAVGLGKRIGYDLANPASSLPMSVPTTQPLSIDPSFFQGSRSSKLPGTAPALSASKPPAVQAPAGPVVSAQAYLIGNVATGQIYAERNGATALPIASMSKLMTAIVATETIAPTTTIEITPLEASVYPDLSRIGADESFTAKEILYPLLLDSSNIAAEALASSTNRAKFIDLMNSSAWEIGLPTTYFADPSGLSPLNQASAEGFFDLAKYVYASRPDLLAITRTQSISVATTTEHGAHDFVSIHPFVNDPRFIGGKTGHTDEAADTMLTILNIGGQPIAFIVLGSNDRTKDTSLLVDQVLKILAAKQ